jgi:hypothetical protein
MKSSFLKKQSHRLVGAVFILLGAATTSQATTLTGYSTYGSMMSGMKVTASFVDGTSQSLFWSATGSRSGGVFGNSWSLTQSGNTYAPDNDNTEAAAWILTNNGLGITSLVIDAIPGNTVFDNLYAFDSPLQTPGSERGWPLQIFSGQSPDSSAYSIPIDISYGDLFGKLSMYWGAGFTGVMKFFADTDSSSSTVYPKDPVAYNSPPKDLAVSFSAPTIYEGQSTSAVVQATDSDEGAITFFVNGGNLGTDFNRSGTRQLTAYLGPYADNGSYVYTAQARDEDGNYSTPVTSVLTVLNLPPTVTTLSIPTIYEGQFASAYISATDPGADGINFYLNNTYVGTDFNTTGTRAVTANLGYFADNTYIPYTGHALDKDGAWSAPAYSALNVLNLAPTLTSFDLSQSVIYEGQSVSALLTATDPGADSQTFFINGSSIGTDSLTSGTRSATTNLGSFSTGTYTFTGQTQDKDGAFSNVVTRTLEVLNIAPTITQLTQNLVAKAGEFFNFSALATDPGGTALQYDWDFNGDGLFDDFTGASGQWSFADLGMRQVNLRVSDGKGGYAYGSFNVESVPEPSSTLGVLVFGFGGAAALWKRKQHRKDERRSQD